MFLFKIIRSKPVILMNICIILICVPISIYFHKKGKRLSFNKSKFRREDFLKRNHEEIQKKIVNKRTVYYKSVSDRKKININGWFFVISHKEIFDEKTKKNSIEKSFSVWYDKENSRYHCSIPYEAFLARNGKSSEIEKNLDTLLNSLKYGKFAKILFDGGKIYFIYFDDGNIHTSNCSGDIKMIETLFNGCLFKKIW